MKNRSNLRKWIRNTVLVVACVTLAMVYCPRSISSALDFTDTANIRVTVIISDSNIPGVPKNESRDYIFQRGSSQYDGCLRY